MYAPREWSLCFCVSIGAAVLSACGAASAPGDAAVEAGDASVGEDAHVDDAGTVTTDAGAASCPPDLSTVENAETLQSELGLELLATNQQVAGSAALLRGRIYWGNRNRFGAVRSVSIEDCEVREVAPMMEEPRSLAADDDAVYWVEGATTRLFRYVVETSRLQELGHAHPVAGLVPLGDTLYSLSSDCRVIGGPKEGGERVEHSPPVGGSGAHLRGDGRALIFACEEPHALYELVATSTTPRLLVRTEKPITALAVTPRMIFWGEDVCADFFDACHPVVLPGCCPGRILAYDRMTGATSTIAQDPDTRPYALAADEAHVWWSNIHELHMLRLGDDAPRMMANDQSIVDVIVLDGAYAYWANPRRKGDLIADPGYVVRVRVPAR